MRGRFWIWAIALLATVIIFLAVVVTWVGWTNGGARWTLDKVSRNLPASITIGRIEGSLIEGLTVEGVFIQLADWEIGIDKMTCSWQPAYLMAGHFAFSHVHLQNLTLLDKNPDVKKPIDLTWPRVPRLLLWMSAGVKDFQIKNLICRDRDKELMRSDGFQARVGWFFGTLSLKEMDLKASFGQIAGTIDAGLERPALSGNIIFKPRENIDGVDCLDLQLKSGKAFAKEQFASQAIITAYTGEESRFKMTGLMGVTRHSLVFHDLQLLEQGRRGTMTANGEIIFSQPDPQLDAEIRLRDLVLFKSHSSRISPLLPMKQALMSGSDSRAAGKGKDIDLSSVSGTLVIKGIAGNYKGRFDLEQKSSVYPWMAGHLKGELQGNKQGLGLQEIKGAILGGNISGSLNWTWQGRRQLSWTGQGRDLDPAKINPKWVGNANIDGVGSLLWGDSQPVKGSLNLKLSKSVFQKKTLDGSLDARWEKGNVSSVRGDLRGQGFHLNVKGTPAERLDCQFNAADLSGLFPGIKGQVTGGGWVRWNKGQTVGVLKGSGSCSIQNAGVIGVSSANIQWDWNEKGLQARWNSTLAPAGTLEVSFSSPESFRPAIPEEGSFKAAWRSIDPGFISPWLAKAFRIQGQINGALQGTLHPHLQVKTSGTVDLVDGRLTWETPQGRITSATRKATARFVWEDAFLKGNIFMGLTGYGHLAGDFQFPLPARFPIKMVTNGPVRLQVKGNIREKGVLSAIFPGAVRESHGNVRFNLTSDGTWETPDFRGKATLEKAGAYFPQIGIRFEDGSAEVEWLRDQMKIQSFRGRTDASDLHGSATLWFKDWRISRYEGQMAGQNVRIVYLPEVRIWASPDLQFSGDMQRCALRGTVLIPEALISPSGKEGVVTASRDVVMVDLPVKKKETASAFILDTKVTIILGDKFQVDAEGLHGRLGGSAILKGENLGRINAEGKIEIVKGYYERYGVKLDIVRGLALFRDEPADLGSLDILALKKIKDAQKGLDLEAGVTITGNLRTPLVKLYGRPAMSERDAISYMVLGRPFQEGSGGSQKEQLAQWAAALFAGSPSSSFYRQLKERLGIDNIGVESSTAGGMTRSLVTVGKYLSPDLYVAFGRSVFGDDYYVSTRYSLLKRWQIESRVGQQSGADIFYRIEFD